MNEKKSSDSSLVPVQVGTEEESPVSAKHKLDVLALVVSLLSLGVSTFALYFAALQPSDIAIGIGEGIWVNQKPKIGIHCAIVNSGSQPTIITGAKLFWETPELVFDYALTSTAEAFSIDSLGRMVAASPAIYTVAQPIVVKPHDHISLMLWLTSTDTAFRFGSGKHRLELRMYHGNSEVGSHHFEVYVSDDDERNIPDAANPGKNVMIDVEDQQ